MAEIYKYCTYKYKYLKESIENFCINIKQKCLGCFQKSTLIYWGVFFSHDSTFNYYYYYIFLLIYYIFVVFISLFVYSRILFIVLVIHCIDIYLYFDIILI